MRHWFLVVSVLLTPSTNAETFSIDIPALQKEAKGVIQQLAGSLGSELKKAKQEGGAPAAITVCNTKAVPLTADINAASDWEISRTSLKLRNPDNLPDAWEKKVLTDFEKKAKIGANLKFLSFSQVVVNEQGQKVFRMMKAIPVGEQCLACHGDKIKPAISERLKALYPNDEATGFSEGQLRGAFSLKKYL